MNNLVVQGVNSASRVDSMGYPRERRAIKRILCLKVDHIGDLLVADFAFRLIREYFPDAEITLICGEWNVELATLMKVADRVYGVQVFNAHGAAQHDARVAERARRNGLAGLQALSDQLGEFDLAFDLRLDEESRDLLKLFRADIYVGSGDRSRFPFLDISIPLSDLSQACAPVNLRFDHRDFAEGVNFKASDAGVELHAYAASLPFTLAITGARSPRECGTNSADTRDIGIALESVEIRDADENGNAILVARAEFARGSPDIARLLDGWSAPEEWGTWSVGPLARLDLTGIANLADKEYTVEFRARAHVNGANPKVAVTISPGAPQNGPGADFVAERFDNLTFSMRVRPMRGQRRAATSPIPLPLGEYEVRVDTLATGTAPPGALRLAVRATRPERVLASIDLGGGKGGQARAIGIAEFTQIESDEPVFFEIESMDDADPSGIRVTGVRVETLRSPPARVPVGHMEKRIANLVMAAALECSDKLQVAGLQAERALTEPTRAPSLDERRFLDLIRARKAEYRVIGFSVGATKSTKRWPFKHLLRFFERLTLPKTHFIVLFGGPGDVAESAALEQSFADTGRVLNLCGKTKLVELSSLIGAMDLYIGYDTGITHLAGKLGVRTIGIFAAVHSPKEWGPVGRNASWITHYTPCSPCYLAEVADCRHGHACMVQLDPEACWAVVSNVLEQLDSGPPLADPTASAKASNGGATRGFPLFAGRSRT